MRDTTEFEALLANRLREYVLAADEPFVAAAIAREAIDRAGGRRTRWSAWTLSPRVRLVWLLALILLTLAVGAATAILSTPSILPSTLERLAFVRDGDVYLADSDGATPTRIARGDAEPATAIDVAWAPDGNEVAALVATRVEVLSPSGSVVAVFHTPAPVGDPAAISWAPDSRHLAVAVRAAGAQVSLWMLGSADGTSVNLQLPPAFQSFIPAVAWSPQGDWIAITGCVCPAGKAPSLWVVAADGSGWREVASSNSGSVWDPVWSPDGSRIAFSRQPTTCATCAEALWVAPLTDAAARRVTDLVGVERGIAWSPDGLRIAVTSFEPVEGSVQPGADRRSRLIVVRADGSDEPIELISGTFSASGQVSGEWITTGRVTWSVDGKRLIYLSSVADEYPSTSVREIAASGGVSRVVMGNVDGFGVEVER